MTKDDILGALPALSQADLAAIQALTASLLNDRTAAVDGPATPLAGLTWQAMHTAVNAPHSLPIGTPAGRSLNKRVAGLEKFLNRHFSGWDSNKVSALAFLTMLIRLLRDDLQERGVRPTILLLANNLIRLPEVFEDAYPGYLEAGLANHVLRHFQKAVPKKASVARKKPRRI